VTKLVVEYVVSDNGDGDGDKAGWISFGRIPLGGGEGGIAIKSREDDIEEELDENELDHVSVLSRRADHKGI